MRQLFQALEDFKALEQANILYLSGITRAILTPSARAAFFARLTALRAAGRRVAFDSNCRSRLWSDAATARQVIAQAWALADIALLASGPMCVTTDRGTGQRHRRRPTSPRLTARASIRSPSHWGSVVSRKQMPIPASKHLTHLTRQANPASARRPAGPVCGAASSASTPPPNPRSPAKRWTGS